jgi:hypothetical protein
MFNIKMKKEPKMGRMEKAKKGGRNRKIHKERRKKDKEVK